MSRPIKTLLFSTLFPSSVRPVRGIFVETRLRELLKTGEIETKSVAPVLCFPFSGKSFSTRPSEQAGALARLPRPRLARGRLDNWPHSDGRRPDESASSRDREQTFPQSGRSPGKIARHRRPCNVHGDGSSRRRTHLFSGIQHHLLASRHAPGIPTEVDGIHSSGQGHRCAAYVTSSGDSDGWPERRDARRLGAGRPHRGIYRALSRLGSSSSTVHRPRNETTTTFEQG